MKNSAKIRTAKYCIGCGLCNSTGKAVMMKGRNGYMCPDRDSITEETYDFVQKVCHLSSKSVRMLSREDIWGVNYGMFFGHSCDENIRNLASSGGAVTAICIYLLESGLVDGIVQIGVSKSSEIETELNISSSREEIIKCCGSRYTVSSPLLNVLDKTEKGKRYAFVGKPCDVTALRNYMELVPEIRETFPFLLGFFCAGLPGKAAEEELLRRLNVSEKNCSKLVYRGNGWPGKTTAVSEDGTVTEMPYKEAWGGILGRDVHVSCRFCMDGVAERADISFGDAWYQLPDGEPSFEEAPGRNVIIPRTEAGKMLLEEAVKSHYIEISGETDGEYLKNIQKYQYSRKVTMRYKMLAHKVIRSGTPYKSLNDVSAFKKMSNKKERIRIFVGTVKRILKKKI